MPIRKLENFHILLWLLKDISWLMNYRILGIFIIFPAIGFAILIAYRSRKNFFQFSHNLAIIFWITANSFWMILEFCGYEEYKIFAVIPFLIGLGIIATYYLQALLRRS